jgi:short-subunit dehydrogenase
LSKTIIIGATSAIAQETAKCFAQSGGDLFLVGRTEAKLRAIRDDLSMRAAGRIETHVLDVADSERHPAMVDAALASLGGVDYVLIAHGTLPDQAECERSVTATLRALEVNFLSTASLLTLIANRLEEQGHGCIAVISSVAGDRGRGTNYVYGAAKGALTIFLQGLRNRLHPAGVAVVTVKPGFVDTPMTAALPKNALFASPERVGRAVYDAMVTGRDVVYVPWFWRPIMATLRQIPEPLFKRLKL